MNNFDKQASIDARDTAIDQAETNAGEEWNKLAESILVRVARTKLELTTDDLRLAGLPDPPNDPRALGAVMRNGAMGGIIVRTDRTINTTRVSAHRRPLRIWRSLIVT